MSIHISVSTDGFDPEIGPNYPLVDFLRDKLGLTGNWSNVIYVLRIQDKKSSVVKIAKEQKFAAVKEDVEPAQYVKLTSVKHKSVITNLKGKTIIFKRW